MPGKRNYREVLASERELKAQLKEWEVRATTLGPALTPAPSAPPQPNNGRIKALESENRQLRGQVTTMQQTLRQCEPFVQQAMTRSSEAAMVQAKMNPINPMPTESLKPPNPPPEISDFDPSEDQISKVFVKANCDGKLYTVMEFKDGTTGVARPSTLAEIWLAKRYSKLRQTY